MLLDGFSVVTECDKIYHITLKRRSIIFCTKIVRTFKNAPYIQMLVNEKEKKVAFRPCGKKDVGATPFYKPPKEGRQALVTINDKIKCDLVRELAGVETDSRFYGKLIEGTVIVDLKEAETII